MLYKPLHIGGFFLCGKIQIFDFLMLLSYNISKKGGVKIGTEPDC